MHDHLLNHLRRFPVDYRHALGILDPRYIEWRSEGKPEYELIIAGQATLLLLKSGRVAFALGVPEDDDVPGIAQCMQDLAIDELVVVGDAGFSTLRPHLADGEWRMSRNYGVSAGEFRRTPLPCVRRLTAEDRHILERTSGETEVLFDYHSTRRDFEAMEQGMPVYCYGAIVDGKLVGFCSANPIGLGVTEISYVGVAETNRRQGLASALLTAQGDDAFARGDAVGYHAGSAGDDLHAMLLKLGFSEVSTTYRYVPAASDEQWRLSWGRDV